MKKELCWRHHRLYFNIVIKRIWLKLKSIQSVESWPLLCMQIKLRHAFQRFNVRTHSTQSRWVVWSKSELNQFELDWMGLNWIELDWIGFQDWRKKKSNDATPVVHVGASVLRLWLQTHQRPKLGHCFF